MQNLIRCNSLSTATKYRLIEKNIINDEQSVDFAFLRLRGYYSQAAMFWLFDKSTILHTSLQQPSLLIEFLEKNKIIVSDVAISELAGINLKMFEKVVKTLKLQPLKIPEDSLFYGFSCNYYKSSAIVPVLDYFITENKTSKILIFSITNRNSKRFITGLEIKHPLGESGLINTRQILLEECQKVISASSTASNQLSYENIEYDKLNWRKIAGHKNFGLLRILANCSDSSYLLLYMGEDNPSETLLKQLSNKAALTLMQRTSTPSETQIIDNEIIETPSADKSIKATRKHEPTTIYQVVKDMVDETLNFVDYAEATKKLWGKTHQYKSYKEEAAENISILRHFSQNSDNEGMIYLKPEDMHLFVIGDRSKMVMVNGETRKIIDIVNDFANNYGTESYNEADKGIKFAIKTMPIQGQDTLAIFTKDRIIEALERLMKHIESITTIKTIKDTN